MADFKVNNAAELGRIANKFAAERVVTLSTKYSSSFRRVCFFILQSVIFIFSVWRDCFSSTALLFVMSFVNPFQGALTGSFFYRIQPISSDVATLGIGVDLRGLEAGAEALNRFKQAAVKVESASEKIGG